MRSGARLADAMLRIAGANAMRHGWVLLQRRRLMQCALIAPLEGEGWLAELPGELGLQLWATAPTRQAAQTRLRETISRFLALEYDRCEAARANCQKGVAA